MAKEKQKRGCMGGCLTQIVQLTFLGFLVIFIYALVVTDGSGNSGSNATAPNTNSTTTPNTSSTTPSNELRVSAADFGDDWPLTVQSGVLRCGRSMAVTFTHGGWEYAINGVARSREGFRPIQEIWQDNPEIPGTKKSIAPLIERGLELCR